MTEQTSSSPNLYRHAGSGAWLIRLSDDTEIVTPPITEAAACALVWRIDGNLPEGVDAHAWAYQRMDDLLADWAECPTDVPADAAIWGAIAAGLLTLPDDVFVEGWHPTGAHLTTFDFADPANRGMSQWESTTTWSVVVTDWDDADRYSVALYRDSDMEVLDPCVVSFNPTPDELIEAVRQACEAGAALSSDPLPAPLPSVSMLAQRYEAEVRASGHEFVIGVAGLSPIPNNVADDELGDHCYEVGGVIAEWFYGDYDVNDGAEASEADIARYDDYYARCVEAARIVVRAFRTEIRGY